MKQIAVFLAAGLVSGGLWAISAAPAHADELPDPAIRVVPSATAPQTRVPAPRMPRATTPRQERTAMPAPTQESRAEFLARITAKYGTPAIRRPAPATTQPRAVTPTRRPGALQAAISAPATQTNQRRQLTIPPAPRTTSARPAHTFRGTPVATRPRVTDRRFTASLAAPIVRARVTPTQRPTYTRTIRPARTANRVATPITRTQRPARRPVVRPAPTRLRTATERATPKPLTVPRSPTALGTDTTAPRSLLKPATPGCESG